MTGSVSSEGGMGGIDPHRGIEGPSEGQDEEARIADTQDRVNTLPEAGELGGEVDIDISVAEDSDIPRPSSHSGEQRALQAAAGRGEMAGPDASGAVGGSSMAAAVNAASGEGQSVGGSRHIDAGGYSADIDRPEDGGINITVTDPDGVTREAGIDPDGHQYLRTDLDDVGRSTVRFGEVHDGEVSVSVEPDDGPNSELTLEVSEDDAEDLTKFNKEDSDKTSDDKVDWVYTLTIINSAAKIMEDAIARGWGTGKPRI